MGVHANRLGAVTFAVAVGVLAGCTSGDGGQPVPPTEPATSAPPSAAPAHPPVASGRPTTAPYHRGEPLQGLLLGLDELHSSLGGRLEFAVDSDQPLTDVTDRPECGGVLSVPTDQVISQTSYEAMHVQVVVDTRGSAADVTQFAIEFSDPAAAQRFLAGQVDMWKRCGKQQLSLTRADTVTQWEVVMVNDSNLAGGMVSATVNRLRPTPDGQPPDPYDTSGYCSQNVHQVSNYLVGSGSCASQAAVFGSLLRFRVPTS